MYNNNTQKCIILINSQIVLLAEMNNNLNQLINNFKIILSSKAIFLFHLRDSIELKNHSADEILVNKFDEIKSGLTKQNFTQVITDSFITNSNSVIVKNFKVENEYYSVVLIFNENELDASKDDLTQDLINSVSEKILEDKNKTLANNDNFHLFAEVSNDVLFILNSEGMFTFLNNAGKKVLQLMNGENIDGHFFEFVSEKDKTEVIEQFNILVTQKKQVEFETNLVSKLGKESKFKITLIPKIENGQLLSLLGIASNIESTKNLENHLSELKSKLTEANRLNEIEKDRALQQINVLNELNNLKNDFISNVSHELRTPLASIIGFAETIAEDKNLTAESQSEFNEVILAESKRLAKLINDILDFSDLEKKKQELRLNTENILEILEESINKIESSCENKGITLTKNLPDGDINLNIDAERIEKALDHLLGNAVKFTKNGGRITVMLREFLKEVEIIISDTGEGIPEEKKPLLFNKFSKANKIGNQLPGAGFGLVTVKQIIDLHKGLINVKSEVNKGTSFIIKLPKYSFN